jgi:hypothetical protein
VQYHSLNRHRVFLLQNLAHVIVQFAVHRAGGGPTWMMP